MSDTEEYAEELREILKPGDTVYCILEHVSQSGMSRDIKLYAIHNGELRHLSHSASKVLDWKRRKNRDGIYVTGAGMDMGFHTVYSLSHILYGEGYALESRWL